MGLCHIRPFPQIILHWNVPKINFMESDSEVWTVMDYQVMLNRIFFWPHVDCSSANFSVFRNLHRVVSKCWATKFWLSYKQQSVLLLCGNNTPQWWCQLSLSMVSPWFSCDSVPHYLHYDLWTLCHSDSLSSLFFHPDISRFPFSHCAAHIPLFQVVAPLWIYFGHSLSIILRHKDVFI